MPTKHTHSSGAVLRLSDGSTAHSVTDFEQEISVDPVTGKPYSEVSALSARLILLGEDGIRREVRLIPLEDGSGVEVRTVTPGGKHALDSHHTTIQFRVTNPRKDL